MDLYCYKNTIYKTVTTVKFLRITVIIIVISIKIKNLKVYTLMRHNKNIKRMSEYFNFFLCMIDVILCMVF
jgi:hypothetical protein